MNVHIQQMPRSTNQKDLIVKTALRLFAKNGYSNTPISLIAKTAKVSQGLMYNFFKSKEELGVEATRYWTEMTGALFASAPYHDFEDPLDQLIAYIDFRRQLLEERSIPEATCLPGSMVTTWGFRISGTLMTFP